MAQTLSGPHADVVPGMKNGLGVRPGSSNRDIVATDHVSLLPSGRSRSMRACSWFRRSATFGAPSGTCRQLCCEHMDCNEMLTNTTRACALNEGVVSCCFRKVESIVLNTGVVITCFCRKAECVHLNTEGDQRPGVVICDPCFAGLDQPANIATSSPSAPPLSAGYEASTVLEKYSQADGTAGIF